MRILKNLSNVFGLSMLFSVHKVEEFTIRSGRGKLTERFILQYSLGYFLSHLEGLTVWRKLGIEGFPFTTVWGITMLCSDFEIVPRSDVLT